MTLVLVFGVWLNVATVTSLGDSVDFSGNPTGNCFVSFVNGSIRIENHTCAEVAAEINKHGEKR